MADMAGLRKEDLTVDGALVKTVLREGEGEEAGRGARVSVQYALRLEEGGEPFDSSAKRRGGVLEFTLGKKKVIPVLELTAKSMKLGELCVVKAESPYAFGNRGLKRKGVPGGACVYLEVELMDVVGGEKVKALAEMSPRERFEQALTCKEKGNELFNNQKFDKALAQYAQSIRYLRDVFYRPSAVQGDKGKKEAAEEEKGGEEGFEEGFEEAKVVEVVDGEGEENGHVEEGGDVVKEASDDKENYQMDKGNEIVDADIEGGKGDDEVVQVIDVSTASSTQVTEEGVNVNEPIEGASNSKQDVPAVNEDAGQIDGAEDKKQEEEDPEEKEVRALHVTALNNLSLCCVKLENYRQAVESASLALKLDPGSSKALYYRGRAKIFLCDWAAARADLVAATNLSDNPGIKREIMKLDRKMKQFAEREKKQAAAMFA